MKKIPFDKRMQANRKRGPEDPAGDKRPDLRRRIGQSLTRLKTDRDLQKRTVLAVTAICIGVGLGEMSRLYGFQRALKEEAAQAGAKALEETAVVQETAGPKEVPATEPETEPEEKPYTPSPDRLNLAYHYPKDSDGEDIIDSYAGQVFKELTIQDSEWLADIYELADIRPAAMAARLGRAPSSVIGEYDPKNEAHDPDDPSTWTVDNWKAIHVSFTDGDGRTSASYSNVKEILAMASVYTYYTDLMDVDAFKAYATRLWEDSHSYSLSMGSLYYCDGCVDKTDEEIAREEILAEEEAAAALAVQEGRDGAETKAERGTEEKDRSADGTGGPLSDEAADPSSVDGSVSDSAGTGSSLGGSLSGEEEAGSSGEKDGQADGAPSAGTAEEAGAGTESGQQVTVIRRTKKKTEEAGQDSGIDAGTEVDMGGQESHSAGAVQEEAEQPAVIRRTKKDLETAESLEGAALASDTDAQMAAAFEGISGADGQEAAAGADGTADISGSAGWSDDGGSSDGGDSGTSSGRQRSKSRTTDCPGHVDLYIRVKLLGLEGKNGLLARDKIGNGSPQEDARWDGWTEENIADVRTICEQDWFADYGLSISSISLSTPLSDAKIRDYMEQLPKDLSETRREIVRFALSSVGRVPYYWGGKASHPGYEGNNFGVLVPSDDKGRILKGLDCSGWISWVYWSVTGERLEGSSTSGLILCGEKISRSELKPGDIIVRTGTNAHVVMFLSWSANGQMNVIHESSASVNNVTIKTMDAAWPYYRKLVD